MGGEVRRQAAEGAPPNNDREVFSEELSHAGIFLIYLIYRRNSPHSQPPWHVPLRVSRRGHIGTVVQQDAYEAYSVQYALIIGIGRDSFV